MTDETSYDLEECDLSRRRDGAVIVRVHSSRRDSRKLPDAVFAFRIGDPQFEFWDAKLRAQEQTNTAV